MKLKRILPYAKELLQDVIKEGDTVVDATAGNGHDTLFLASLVGNQGHVFAFDVQTEAIESTSERLSNAAVRDRVSLILDSHGNVSNYIDEQISAAVFNLGYLPGSNHEVVTRGNSTIQAITSLLDLLKIGGLIVLVVYHGHEGGKQEKDEVISFVQQLPQSFVHVLCYQFLNQENDPPFIIAIEKMKDR
ncbi:MULTISPECIES: class I SAM-dependent methyltransferase [unclassified Psychrobacillus]|uniref:class I SAM-dependent methyltransferase n=1 Tax=unclassified Psychrobacillus TaxID=2636677 RepID=UPI00146A42D2|nr:MULTISPECIES: class I SAM-dependent methyltransferase [unclassified Psychrobacillus]MCM3359312.1 methyltransferase domain-containing protein [Psychrobacillus sp. MER TA 171]NME06273.1 methyltransferase domain-containing protein [Psychrobacillus sp. BL-248-WT-3]